MRFITSCGLLVALAATTALAQTHPKKKPARKPAVVRKQVSEAPDLSPIERMCDRRSYDDTPTQAVQSDTTKVYIYVEQMPTLNGQHALFASMAAITRLVVAPADAPEGRVFVQFVVTRVGAVSQPHVIKGLRADMDSAVVAATRKLPRFTPGKQNGRVVAVSLALAVTFPVEK